MKPNKKSVLKKLADEAESNKAGRVTLYLNSKIYSDFKKTCEKEGYAASAVVEKMMEEFISQ